MPFSGVGTLSARVSREPRRGWGMGKSRSLMQISPVTLETHVVGTFSKHWRLLSSMLDLFPLMCYYLTLLLCFVKKKGILHLKGEFNSSLVEGEWKTMLAEENLHLKSGRCCWRWLSRYYSNASFWCFDGGNWDIPVLLFFVSKKWELIIKYHSIYSLLKSDSHYVFPFSKCRSDWSISLPGLPV